MIKNIKVNENKQVKWQQSTTYCNYIPLNYSIHLHKTLLHGPPVKRIAKYCLFDTSIF